MMSYLQKLRSILEQFDKDYAQGIIRNLRDSLDTPVNEEDLEDIIGFKLQEDTLTVNKYGGIYYLNEYLLVNTYNEIEDSAGRYNPNLPDYQCRLVKKLDKYYILEILSKELLEDRDFFSFDEWHTYLKRLNTIGIIELENCHEIFPSNRIITIYGVPDGYEFLNKFLEHNRNTLNNPTIIFELLQKINWACAQTVRTTNRLDIRRTFSFVTLHSHFLLVNTAKEPMLCAIGASLVSRPLYVSATCHGKMIQPDGMGLSAYSLFIGYLLFELLADICPVRQAMNLNSSEKDLSDSEHLESYPKHVQAFIKRSTESKSDWRYLSYSRISEDLKHIKHYFTYISNNDLNKLQMEVVQFVDFIRLRFNSHSQNPTLAKLPLESITSWLLNNLAKDFNLYFKDKTRFHNLYNDLVLENNPYLILPKYNKATPLTQHIVQYFSFWSALCEQWHLRPNPMIYAEVEFIGTLFLLKMMEHEIIAFTQSVARARFLQGRLTKTADIIPNIEEGYQCLCNQITKDYRSIALSEASINLVNNLISPPPNLDVSKIRILERLEHFDAISIFIFWAYSSLELVDANINVKFSNLDTSMKDNKLQEALNVGWLIWEYYQRLVQIFPKNIESTASKILTQHTTLSETWEFSLELLQTLWKNLPTKRVPAKIIRYKKSVHTKDRGSLNYQNTFFRRTKSEFNELDLIRQDDIERNVTNMSAKVDIFPDYEGKLGAVLVTSSLGFPDIPQRQSIFESKFDAMKNIIIRIPKHLRRIIAVIITGIVASLGLLFAYEQIEPIAQIGGAEPRSGYAPLEVQFFNESSNSDDYLWTFNTNTESSDFEPIYVFEEPGEYVITLYAYRSILPELPRLTKNDTIIINVFAPETSADNEDLPAETMDEIEATRDVSPTPTSR